MIAILLMCISLAYCTGVEFRAIFLSTSERTSKDGESIYHTKSVSDRYIFNTAITRSRSLVVAVGNPFLLLKIEKHMMKKYPKNAQCWTLYIKQCIESKTFTYSEQLRNSESFQALKPNKLLQLLYSEKSNKIGSVKNKSKKMDSIIEAYKKVFEKLCGNKKTKLTLMTTPGAHLSWSLKEESIKEALLDTDYVDSYDYILKIESTHEAEAIPIDRSKKIVKIQGINNRKGAFDGDQVTVDIFPNSLQDKCYGRILTAKRDSEVRLVCTVSYTNPIVFHPTDNKNPIMINLPRLSRKKDGINKERIESDLKCTDVVVFDPNSIEVNSSDNDSLPQIKQLIPLSVARDMVFLVSLVKWDKQYPSPLGIVIGAYPKCYTPFNAERLLKLKYAVEYIEDEPISEGDAEDIKRDQNLNFYNQAFTIDSKEAQNLDNALSIVKISTDEDRLEEFQLGVHVVNAAKHIESVNVTEHNNEPDAIARSRGISVYGGEKGKIMHMLPYETRSRLSLTPGKIRDVISVTCTVTIDHRAPTSLELSDIQIKAAQIKSAIQLTYEDAQDLLDGKIPTEHVNSIRMFDQDNRNLSLQEAINLLYDITRVMRHRRLKSDAAYVYNISDYEESLCWQSHLLVEELMIWANSEAAKNIHSFFPNTAILKAQPSPNIEEIRKYVEENKHVMLHSLYLSHYLQTSGMKRPSAGVPLKIPINTLKKIHKALSDRNLVLLASLLSTDQLYPQLAAASSKLHSILSHAEYHCTKEDKNDTSAYYHENFCLDKYTHFTSPLQRYVDIEVQRMLLKKLKQDTEAERKLEHTKLCTFMNRKIHSASEFEQEMKRVKLAFNLTSSSEVYSCFVSQSLKGTIELIFPQSELRQLPIRTRKLRSSHLNPDPEKVIDQPDPQLYSWNVHVTSLNSDLAASILKSSSEYMNINPSSLKDSNIKAFSLEYSDDSLDIEYFEASQQDQVVEISPSNWEEALKFIKNPTKGKMDKIRQFLPDLSHLSSSSTTHLIKPHKKYFFLDYNIRASLEPFSILKVWLTGSMREPLISPAIQLVELSPLLRICVQHNSHPAECFSDPNLKQASKAEYASIEEYVDLWKAVLLAEAAEKSIKESQTVIIQDVHLQWPKLIIPEECFEEPYYVPSGYVKMAFPRDFKNQCREFFQVEIGTLVCVRYGTDPLYDSVRAIFHFVVHHINDDNDDRPDEVTILMKPVSIANCKISKSMKQILEAKESTCEVQIIILSYTYT